MAKEKGWLRIPASIDQVAGACEFVSAFAEDLGFDARTVYHCQMAIDEALTNIIEHGYGGDSPDSHLDVTCVVDEKDFVVTLVDDSHPFDPLARDDPDPDQALMDRVPGGWGIFFIKKMMDRVSYTYHDGRNHLRMYKALPPKGIAKARPGSRPEPNEIAPGVWLIRPNGRLDSMRSRPLEQTLKAEFDAGHTRLIIDMHKVSYISSSGLKVLLGAWREAHNLQGVVTIVAMPQRVREVFEMVGFHRIFQTFATVEEAVEAINTRTLAPERSA